MTRLTDEQRDRAGEAYALAVYLCRRLVRMSRECGRMTPAKEDRMYDAAVNAAMAAGRDFDPRRGAPMSALVGRAAIRRVRQAAQRADQHPLRAETDRAERLAVAPAPPRPCPLDRSEAVEAVGRLLACVSPRKARVLASYYGIGGPGHTIRDTARATGETRARVKTLLHEGRTEMRRAARNLGIKHV